MFFGEKGKHTKIRDLVKASKERALPVIHENAPLQEIIDAMIRSGHSRLLYVVDEEEKLLGTISLGMLLKQVFTRSHDPQIHPRRLMDAITFETAEHMMQKHPVFAREDEDLHVIIRRMIRSNVKEMAVLDHEGKVVGDMTILDVLKLLSQNAKR